MILGLLWTFATPVLLKEVKQFQEKREYYKEFAIEKYEQLKDRVEEKIPEQIPLLRYDPGSGDVEVSLATRWGSGAIQFEAAVAEQQMHGRHGD